MSSITYRNPTVYCELCDRKMYLAVGNGPGIRPDRAKKILRRSCQTPSRCVFGYTAGIAPAGRVEGQGE